MIEFSLFGIRVRVEPMFWLTCALLGGAFRASTKAELLGVALFVIAAFISILIHEFGHALMIKKYHLPTEVVLTTMGGYATYPQGVLSRKQSFFVTAAGPAVQLLFGLFVLFGVLQQVHIPNPLLQGFVKDLIWVSIVWALFNCLPIFPLDGGQMLSAVLGPRRRKGLHLTGIITAALIGFWGISSGQLFIAIFMAFFAYQNWQYLQQVR